MITQVYMSYSRSATENLIKVALWRAEPRRRGDRGTPGPPVIEPPGSLRAHHLPNVGQIYSPLRFLHDCVSAPDPSLISSLILSDHRGLGLVIQILSS